MTYWRKGRRNDPETFDRRQDRNRRGDSAVAIEHGGSDDAGEDQLPPPAPGFVVRRHQCGQREDAPLTFVVGSHHHEHVLDRDHQDQGPKDQRQGSEH